MPNRNFVVVAALGALLVPAGTTARGRAARPPAAAHANVRGGLTVYVDPLNGRLLDAPAPGAEPLFLPDRLVQATRTDAGGLFVAYDAVTGASVDLAGRAQQPLLAHVTPAGRIEIYHPRSLVATTADVGGPRP